MFNRIYGIAVAALVVLLYCFGAMWILQEHPPVIRPADCSTQHFEDCHRTHLCDLNELHVGCPSDYRQ